MSCSLNSFEGVLNGEYLGPYRVPIIALIRGILAV